jgi:hypothetical protein
VAIFMDSIPIQIDNFIGEDVPIPILRGTQ